MIRISTFFWNIFLRLRIIILLKLKYKKIKYFKRWDNKIEGYKCTFDQNFKSGLNENVWSTKLYTGLRFDINPIIDFNKAPNEYYNDQCLDTENGILKINTKPSDRLIEYADDNYVTKYDTGTINSSKGFIQECGLFEIRLKMPTVKGMLFRSGLRSFSNNLLDITILKLDSQRRKQLENSVNNQSKKSVKVNKSISPILDSTSGYFTYTCKWQGKLLKFYYQNILVSVIKIPNDYNEPLYFYAEPKVNNSTTANTISIDYIRAYTTE